MVRTYLNISILNFIDSFQYDSNNGNHYFVTISKNHNVEKSLYDEYNRNLKFPYFGYNWNALSDLLRDFCWIKERDITIIHQDLPLINDRENCKIYLDVLLEAIDSWKDDEKHKLHVVFPVYYKDIISDLISEIER